MDRVIAEWGMFRCQYWFEYFRPYRSFFRYWHRYQYNPRCRMAHIRCVRVCVISLTLSLTFACVCVCASTRSLCDLIVLFSTKHKFLTRSLKRKSVFKVSHLKCGAHTQYLQCTSASSTSLTSSWLQVDDWHARQPIIKGREINLTCSSGTLVLVYE